MAYVLIVDDEETVCLVLQNIIKAEGHECEVATNNNEAKAALKLAAFDLVTLDIRMPGASGMDLLGYIGSEYPDTAVVMITYIEDPNVAKLALEKGAYGYISKPFDREEIIITIHSALKRRQAELTSRQCQIDQESIIISRTQELVESEAKYRDLVQSVNSVIMRINSEGVITFFNDYGLHFFGYKSDELIGRSVVGTISPERDSAGKDLGVFIEALKREPEAFYYTESENRKKNGDVVWMAWTNRVIVGSKKGVEVLSVGTDITDRKKAEQIVKESEEHLRFLLDSIAGGIMIINAEDHIITDVNTTASKLFGLPKQDIIGQECHQFVCPAEKGKCPYTDLGEKVDNSDRVIIDSTGKLVPILKTILPITIKGKAHLLETFIDITDRKQAEDKLEEQYILLQTLIDTIPSPIFYKDTSGLYLGCNKAFEGLVGDVRERIIGKTIYDFFPMEAARLHDENDAQLIESMVIQMYEAEFEYADGIVRQTLVQKAVFNNSSGELAGIVGIMTDTTEVRRMERRLQQAQKLESIGQLAAGIAHEINTPTQFIQGNIEFLSHALKDLAELIEEYRTIVKNTPPESPAADLVEKVQAEAQKIDLDYLFEEIPEAVSGALDGVERITRIVDSMRYFSHPGRLETTMVNINEAIENSITVSRNHWKYCADISTALDPDLPRVPAYAAEFNQVLLNLIINAADAICEIHGENPKEKGSINISNRRDGDMIEIKISDNGAGIPETVRSRIFDPFFTTKDIGKGTGQGLAIAYNVVAEMHGGDLEFETEMGNGTTFIIRIPTERDEAARIVSNK